MEHVEASIVGVLRAIFIFALLFVGVRLLGRLFSSPRTTSGKRTPSRNADRRKEGEVRIEYTDGKAAERKRREKLGGEYVDYEEID